MVSQACLTVRKEKYANELSDDITREDIDIAIHGRANGTPDYSAVGECLLNSIDTTMRAVPHTNDAAKRAHIEGEAMNHAFGFAMHWLTVTPDDDNSFLLQVFTRKLIDDDERVQDLSDEYLASRAEKHTELRIKYPGMCAYFFEVILDIVI